MGASSSYSLDFARSETLDRAGVELCIHFAKAQLACFVLSPGPQHVPYLFAISIDGEDVGLSARNGV